jgi:putative sigma-54 modulation protein
MRIEITSKSMDLTDALREHMEKRLLKIKRYFDGVIDVHVVVKLERFIHRFEITLHGQGFDFFSEGHAEDVYAAFDGAAEKMERQVRKMKDKIRHRRNRGGGMEAVASGEPAGGDEGEEQ